MSLIETEGLIIKEVNFGESSKILTVLTCDFGKIQVVANRIRTNRSGYMKGSQLFSYSWFSLYKTQKNMYRINDVESREYFSQLRESLNKLAYATYFADIICRISDENIMDKEQLSLILNTFHFICNEKVEHSKLKTIYEFRSMSLGGFMPDINTCFKCKDTKNLSLFDLNEGIVYCDNCAPVKNNLVQVNDTVLNAIKFIIHSESSKIFWFDLSDTFLEYLNRISERYVAVHIEKNLKSLDYLKMIQYDDTSTISSD